VQALTINCNYTLINLSRKIATEVKHEHQHIGSSGFDTLMIMNFDDHETIRGIMLHRTSDNAAKLV
jgi:hypothetical protein